MINPNRFYTYAYLRKDGSPYYIGKGTKNRAYNKHQDGINLPKDKFRIIFLKQNLTEEEAFKHEKYMIAVFGRKDLGTGILYNRTDGGEGASGIVFSEERKKRIGEETKRKWETGVFTECSYEKWSNAVKGEKNPMYGKTHTEESKEKIRNTHIGRIWSDELKLKKANSMRGDDNHFYGKKHTQKTKDKIIKRHYKMWRFISPTGEIVEEYTTLRKFCEKYSLDRKSLHNVINRKASNHKGWTVAELTQDPLRSS
jgi:group I intron endonuclease